MVTILLLVLAGWATLSLVLGWLLTRGLRRPPRVSGPPAARTVPARIAEVARDRSAASA